MGAVISALSGGGRGFIPAEPTRSHGDVPHVAASKAVVIEVRFGCVEVWFTGATGNGLAVSLGNKYSAFSLTRSDLDHRHGQYRLASESLSPLRWRS